MNIDLTLSFGDGVDYVSSAACEDDKIPNVQKSKRLAQLYWAMALVGCGLVLIASTTLLFGLFGGVVVGLCLQARRDAKKEKEKENHKLTYSVDESDSATKTESVTTILLLAAAKKIPEKNPKIAKKTKPKIPAPTLFPRLVATPWLAARITRGRLHPSAAS